MTRAADEVLVEMIDALRRFFELKREFAAAGGKFQYLRSAESGDVDIGVVLPITGDQEAAATLIELLSELPPDWKPRTQ